MINLKPLQIPQVFNVIRDLMDVNDNPFRGQAKRLLYEMQPELEYLQKADKEDVEAIKDREIEFGEKIVAPQHYPNEYKEVLELVCNGVKEKQSKLATLAESDQ